MHKTRLCTRLIVLLSAVAVLTAASGRADDRQDASRAKELQLLELLRSDSPAAEKAVACKQLAVYGSSAAVPELARLLSDPQLASWSRIALEAIPGPAPDDALRAALESLDGNLLIGAINSIGVRRGEDAVDSLIARLQHENVEVASAAAVALGRIGNVTATAALRKELAGPRVPIRGSVAEGCVLSAERMLSEGRAEDAAKLYDEVRKAEVPKPRILEATRGAILARSSDSAIPLLLEQLRSPDKGLYYLGLSTAREMPGGQVAVALVAELGRAAPERAAMVLVVLADRNEVSQLPAVLAATEKGDRIVRIAAVEALKRLGDASCLSTLLGLGVDSDDKLALAAKTTLAGLGGEKVDSEIVARLSKAEGKVYPLLIELVGERRIRATQPLIKALDNRDAVVRTAALKSLGAVVGPDSLKVLITQVVSPKNADDAPVAQQALKTASVRMPDREVCAAELSAAYDRAPVATKLVLLPILGAVGGTKSLETISAAARTSDPQLQDSSSKLLGEWLNADPAPVLLDLSKTAKGEKYQVRALRGYLRIARQFAASDEQRAEMCLNGLEVASQAAEKKLVLDVLKSKPHLETLKAAAKCMEIPELKEEATVAALTIIQKLASKGADAKELLARLGMDPVEVEIVKAEYGAGSNQTDVTETLRKQVGSLVLIALSNASYNASFGGDPAPGAVKQLKVQYKINGKPSDVSFAEDAAIILPMPE